MRYFTAIVLMVAAATSLPALAVPLPAQSKSSCSRDCPGDEFEGFINASL